MSKDVLRAIALGIGGLVVALVLTVGAFAIAGQDISQPAGVPIITVTPSPSSARHETEDEHSREPKETASPSVDDHAAGANPADGGGSAAAEGPDDHGSGSGSGSDDHGGSSGSSSSGAGSGRSSGSGSTSDPSGSGSGSGSDDSGGHGDD